MYRFCVDAVTVNPHLRAAHGVLRAGLLPLSADAVHAARLLAQAAHTGAAATRRTAGDDAAALVADARAEAGAIVAGAQAEAARLLEAARLEAGASAAAERQRVVRQAGELLGALEQANQTIVEQAEGLVLAMAGALFDRLVIDLTPAERIAAALARVLQEAPPRLAEPLLRVHPDDVGLLPPLDWPLKTDARLAPGACRLEAASGHWSAGFDLAVGDLRAALAGLATAPPAPPQ